MPRKCLKRQPPLPPTIDVSSFQAMDHHCRPVIFSRQMCESVEMPGFTASINSVYNEDGMWLCVLGGG